MQVRDILRVVESWSPSGTALSYDNVGLQVGRPEASVSNGLIALDLTQAVLDEAVERGAELIVTHHPLLFSPLRSVSPDSYVGGMVYRLIQHNIALLAMHTNLDATPGGVSFELADRLGLEGVSVLGRLESSLFKLVTFVPEAHSETVRSALGRAGAGRIGDYADCAFESPGNGSFRALEGASPFLGQAGGKTEVVPEVRLEVQVNRWDIERVVAALKAAHPYEEVAYDVYPLEQPHTMFGMGAIGSLPDWETLMEFLGRVARSLRHPALRYVGDPASRVKTVAVCGGSGQDLAKTARKKGADAFVTADLKYHNYFDVLDDRGVPAMALIDAGHYETEAPAEDLLLRELTARIPDVTWTKTEVVTSPIRYHTASFSE